jgi:hypothetical protein
MVMGKERTLDWLDQSNEIQAILFFRTKDGVVGTHMSKDIEEMLYIMQ